MAEKEPTILSSARLLGIGCALLQVGRCLASGRAMCYVSSISFDARMTCGVRMPQEPVLAERPCTWMGKLMKELHVAKWYFVTTWDRPRPCGTVWKIGGIWRGACR